MRSEAARPEAPESPSVPHSDCPSRVHVLLLANPTIVFRRLRTTGTLHRRSISGSGSFWAYVLPSKDRQAASMSPGQFPLFDVGDLRFDCGHFSDSHLFLWIRYTHRVPAKFSPHASDP